MAYLIIPELREGVNNDTKDDVQANGGDDDEEGDVKGSFVEVVGEGFTTGDLQELHGRKTCCIVHRSMIENQNKMLALFWIGTICSICFVTCMQEQS